jgi:hypothetical protein
MPGDAGVLTGWTRRAVENPKLTADERDAALARLHCTVGIGRLADRDVVVEAVAEKWPASCPRSGCCGIRLRLRRGHRQRHGQADLIGLDTTKSAVTSASRRSSPVAA